MPGLAWSKVQRKLQARAIKDAGGWRLTELTLELLPNQTTISTACRDLCIIRAQGFDRVEAVLRQYGPDNDCVRFLIRRFSQFSDLPYQNSRYKDGTTWACNLAFSRVPYRALQSDRCLVITT